ncbi:phospholipase D-like domain-containing protein [Aeromonas salmonicida]|uniref:phospholipase D-like domain-containing protein n=1 Tax=Aeromonas salmonicida TaxID=645 RepID=UPI00145B22CB|nr:phospholipase D-like domain-containing protein [Aeromonas salmonicida]
MKTINVYFENIEQQIHNELNKAQKIVKICVAWFSSPRYISTIKSLRERNVIVELICNKDRPNSYIDGKDFDFFLRINSYFHYGLMHHKFCVIDNSTVITGSYNWSKNASNHLENIIVAKNDFNFAKLFLHEFEDIKLMDSSYARYVKEDKINNYDAAIESGLPYRNKKFINVLISSFAEDSRCLFSLWRMDLEHGNEERLDYFYEQIIDDDADEYSDDISDDVYHSAEEMIIEFNRERAKINNNLQHQSQRNTFNVHALAYIQITNWHDHMKYGEDLIHELYVYWKNPLYRKLIPNEICNQAIINWILNN